VSSGSRNGDSYSGDVYRIVISPGSRDIEDFENNNNTHSSNRMHHNSNGATKASTVDANGNEDGGELLDAGVEMQMKPSFNRAHHEINRGLCLLLLMEAHSGL
uniref:Uncharacterized protein n=1 Tax=Anopheles maculatus TaxID=74869 RepID=A0A182SD35_9DIPT